MQNTGLNGGRVKAEDVISKLKDDGDFDRLRLKIVRKLKDNIVSLGIDMFFNDADNMATDFHPIMEELRSNVISMVKQSAALNHPGAENMKPRQLSDAIHQEIGDKLMSRISNDLWNIIRSSDGMNTEIKETVESVYEKLSNPQGNDNGESSSHSKLERCDVPRALEELNAPPGFGLVNGKGRNEKKRTNQPKNLSGLSPSSKGKGMEENEDLPPPGFSSALKRKNSGDASDEDPDLPPGFS